MYLKLVDVINKIHRFFWKILHLSLYKNPEDVIPKGTWYCYTLNGKNGYKMYYVDIIGEGKELIELPYYGADYCPFHKKAIDKLDLCMYDGGDCLMDSCKTCGINEDKE